MLKQPHQHVADAFPGKSGSPYQAIRSRRKVSLWDIVSTTCVVAVVLVLLFCLPWASGW